MADLNQGKHHYYINSDISKDYHSTRPTYPAEVYDTILSYMASGYQSERPCFDLAVDIACGTGLTTIPLAKHFKKVIGCDLSETQIQEAQRINQYNSIEYRVSAAEDLAFLQDGSVDLVTCVGAIQYMDKEIVGREVKNKLRNNGVFAIYACLPPSLATSESQRAFDEYFDKVSKSPCDYDFECVLNMYEHVKLPLDDLQRNTDMTVEWALCLSDYLKYLQGWGLYQNWLKYNPHSDIIQILGHKLKTALASEGNEDPIIHLSARVFIMMGRKI